MLYSRVMTNKYEELGKQIGALVGEKNVAYGDSFGQVGSFLQILYPNGIPVESYTDALCIVRIFDKLKRIATHKDAFGESPYRDIAGYALLGTIKDELAKEASSETVEQNRNPTSKDVVLLKG